MKKVNFLRKRIIFVFSIFIFAFFGSVLGSGIADAGFCDWYYEKEGVCKKAHDWCAGFYSACDNQEHKFCGWYASGGCSGLHNSKNYIVTFNCKSEGLFGLVCNCDPGSISMANTPCQYGCENGACLPKPVSCVDSDGKDNFLEAGTCTDEYGQHDDFCYFETAFDYYCDAAEKCKTTYKECEFGCESGGKCIQQSAFTCDQFCRLEKNEKRGVCRTYFSVPDYFCYQNSCYYNAYNTGERYSDCGVSQRCWCAEDGQVCPDCLKTCTKDGCGQTCYAACINADYVFGHCTQAGLHNEYKCVGSTCYYNRVNLTGQTGSNYDCSTILFQNCYCAGSSALCSPDCSTRCQGDGCHTPAEDETPPDETPPDETPPDETPPDETPPDETPLDETPPDETPPDETPPDETPGKEDCEDYCCAKYCIVGHARTGDCAGGGQCCEDSQYCTSTAGGTIIIENPLLSGTFEGIIGNVIDFVFNIALVVVPLMVIVGGVLFVTSGGNIQQVDRAKKLLIYSVLGFIIVLLSKGILAMINKILGVKGG